MDVKETEVRVSTDLNCSLYGPVLVNTGNEFLGYMKGGEIL
jgi:hypothetical protein